MTDLSPVDRTLATRRLRTQAERDADGTTWRGQPPTHVYEDAREAARQALDEEPELTVPGHLVQRRMVDAAVEATWSARPPRRRWWHRYTRRNP